MAGLLDSKTPYPEVRSLERGLQLLEALGEYGWCGPTELAQKTGIDRSTIYRLLETLRRTGFVVRRQQDAKFFLSAKFKGLNSAVEEQDFRLLLISEPLRELVKEIKWPSDFAALNRGRLVILDSTHRYTTLTFYRAVIGKTRPILQSSLGRAILAAMSDDEREEAIQTVLLAGGPDAEQIRDRAAVEAVVAATRQRGFGLSIGEITPRISAIALPVMAKGSLVGAVNIIFFTSAFKPTQADKYLEPLRRTVTRMEQAFSALP